MEGHCTMRLLFWPGVIFCSMCQIAAEAQLNEPWDGPAFAADPSAMLRAASAVHAGPEVDAVILLREDHIVFDDAGRSTQTRRTVTRVVTKQGAEDLSTMDARWKNWHQERPLLRARVITADGRVHELDP